jgi:enoyl-CoA hydratase
VSRYELPEELKVESVGAVRVVTLNRPEKVNSVSQVLHHALTDVWGQIAADEEARAVVLTGAGRAFCAGGDAANFIKNHYDPEHRRRSIRGARKLADTMIDFPLPVVAAVNGLAIGLGCTLAVLCDMVLMSDQAYMAESHVGIGLVAGDGGAAIWPQMMSMLKAKELVLLGDRISAEDAVRLGLANRVVPAASLMEEAMATAQRFAELPAQSVQQTKRAMNIHLKKAADDVMDFALEAEYFSFGTDEAKATAERLTKTISNGS